MEPTTKEVLQTASSLPPQAGNGPTSPSELAGAPEKQKVGTNPFSQLMALRAALNSPVEHFTVDLDINRFKKFAKQQGLSKPLYNKAVREYKEKAWTEYSEHLNHKGSFPVHKETLCQSTV